MATTPKEFFSKNMKWFAIGFLVLFMFKGIQSCNRQTEMTKISKVYTTRIDSLTRLTENFADSINQLKFELKIANNNALSSEEKAKAIQNTVDKIKSNTTVTIKKEKE